MQENEQGLRDENRNDVEQNDADKKAKPTQPQKPSPSVWTEVHSQTLEQLKEKSKERLKNLPGNSEKTAD